MMLDKQMRRELGIVLIIFAAYNLLVFLIPFPLTEVFWLAYAFDLAAIVAQAPVILVAHKNGRNLRSRFYGFPIIRLGIIYLCVQLTVSFVIMPLSPWMPRWLAVLLFELILAFFAVGLIAADTIRDEIEFQDKKRTSGTFVIVKLRSVTAVMEQQCENADTQKIIRQLADQLRYSDPVSSAVLQNIENSIFNCVREAKNAMANQRYSETQRLCLKAMEMLTERNELCKQNK